MYCQSEHRQHLLKGENKIQLANHTATTMCAQYLHEIAIIFQVKHENVINKRKTSQQKQRNNRYEKL
jgi:hypothetical protein